MSADPGCQRALPGTTKTTRATVVDAVTSLVGGGSSILVLSSTWRINQEEAYSTILNQSL